MYNYIDAGFFDARNIDLPRKFRYRPRRKKKEFKVDRGCYIGRSYEEYQKYFKMLSIEQKFNENGQL